MNLFPSLKKYFPAFLFLVFLFAGLAIYKDYGMYWDDPAQRNIGKMNYFYLESKDSTTLPASLDRYHGPAFELFLFTLERKIGFHDTKSIFQFRHLVNFLLFFVASVFFYFLCLRHFKNRLTALAGFLFLVLSPRIFADAFYNSKDLPCLCFNIIGLYTFSRLFDKVSWSRAIWHGIACGVFMDIRMSGIILPLLTIVVIPAKLIFQDRSFSLKAFLVILSFVFSFCMSAYIFWPILWHHPLPEIQNAFKQLTHYPWDGIVLYMGQFTRSTALPWHYLPVWVSISTPPLYLFLFITGVCFHLYKLTGGVKKYLDLYAKDFFFLLYFLFPVLAVILLKSVLYEGWRHLYFIYPIFLLVSLFGLNCLYLGILEIRSAQTKNILRIGFLSGVIACMTSTFISMVKLHPLENIYFNFLAGKNLKEIKNKYDMDYWGLSYRQGLEYILSHDSSPLIRIYAYDEPGSINSKQFTAAEKARLQFTSTPYYCDYFITDYRIHPQEFKGCEELFSVIRDSAKVMTVYKVLHQFTPGKTTFSQKHFLDFEESPVPAHWSPNQVVIPEHGAHSGLHANKVDENAYYSATLDIETDSSWLHTKNRFLQIGAWYFLPEKGSSPTAILSIQNPRGESTHWQRFDFAQNEDELVNTWRYSEIFTEMPEITSPGEKIRIYFITSEKKSFLLDDISVEIFEPERMDLIKPIW